MTELCPAVNNLRGGGPYRCTKLKGHEGLHSPVPCCPIPDCMLPRKHNQMMCRTHWMRVGKALRDRIWALVKKGRLHDYLDARNEAIITAANWKPKGRKL